VICEEYLLFNVLAIKVIAAILSTRGGNKQNWSLYASQNTKGDVFLQLANPNLSPSNDPKSKARKCLVTESKQDKVLECLVCEKNAEVSFYFEYQITSNNFVSCRL
jgi:hypothetical protein